MTDLHIPDYVQVEIDGVDRTEYVINYDRHSNICEMGDSFGLELSPEYPVNIDPYTDILIKERYDGTTGNVLRGYITNIDRGFNPGSYLLQGIDKSIKLFDYFIPEQIFANGESVDYWIQYLADLVNLDVQFDATSTAIVEPETPLGFQTAGEAIGQLERLAAYYVKYDSSIDKLRVFRLETSEPQTTVNEALNAIRSLGTENTRNVVKVYGGFKYNIELGTTEQVIATVKSDLDELIADKTVVVSHPGLKKQTYAYIVASRILNVVNSIDDVQVYQLEGLLPGLDVGDIGNIDWNRHWTYNGSRIITGITTSVSERGATTDITFGEKCPRLSINLPPSPVFVSTISGGVGVSWDAGDTFVSSNVGLTGPALNVHSIAANNYGQQMIITDDGIYRRSTINGAWTQATQLSDPVSEVEDDPDITISGATLLKIVEEPTNYSTFHVGVNATLSGATTSGDSRSWIYTTQNLGNTWNSMQLSHPQTFGSGSIYNVAIRDMESSELNNITVLSEDFFTIDIINPTGKYWITGFSAGESTSFHERFLVTSSGVDRDSGSSPEYWRTIPDQRNKGYTYGELGFPAGSYELRRYNTAWDTNTIVRPWSGDLTTDEIQTVHDGPFGIEESPGNIVNLAWTVIQEINNTGNTGEHLLRLEGWFFEDDLSETSDYQETATKEDSVINTHPKTYTTSDPNRTDQFSATAGEWIENADSDDWKINNGVGNWEGIFLENTIVNVITAQDGGTVNLLESKFSTTGDKIFLMSFGITAPSEGNTGEHFPGDMQIWTIEVDIPGKTITAGDKLIEEFMLDTSVFPGPHDESTVYGYDDNGDPNTGSDGRTYIWTNSFYGYDGVDTFYFGLSLTTGGETTDPLAQTWIFSCSNGNISDPIGPVEWSDIWGSSDYTDYTDVAPYTYMLPLNNSTYPGVFTGSYDLFADTGELEHGKIFTPTASVTDAPGVVAKEGAAYTDAGVILSVLTQKTAPASGVIDIAEYVYGSASPTTLFLSENGLQQDMFRHPEAIDIAASGATT